MGGRDGNIKLINLIKFRKHCSFIAEYTIIFQHHLEVIAFIPQGKKQHVRIEIIMRKELLIEFKPNLLKENGNRNQ